MTSFTHREDVTEHAMTRSRTGLTARAAALALVAAACSGDVEQALARAARSKRAAQATCTGTGAHDRHQALGVGCTVCHPGDGGTYGFEAYAYPGGTSSAGGVILLASADGPTTCTVACHSPLGSPAHPVTWDTPAPLDCTACHGASSLADGHPAVAETANGDTCLGCHDQAQHTSGAVKLRGHDTTWMAQGDPGFHAFSANRGLAACQDCHGRDLGGGASGVACGRCHDRTQPDGTVLAWSKDCTMCHGGTDSQTGAPPRTTWGRDADLVRVGAHTKHAGGTALAPAFDCQLCHVKPADAFAAGHVDRETATVDFAGLAVRPGGAAAAWDRTTATCSNTYCHGSAAPRWTGGAAEAACGTCHGLPPTTPHPAVGSDLTGCTLCHEKTMDALGNVIPPSQGGTHLDGVVQSTGHDASWMDTASAAFHAFAADRGLGPCQACHGAALDGGTAQVGCGKCHDERQPDGTIVAWSRNCLMCHGGGDGATGAPPRATWGNAGDPVRVGAHTVHLAGSAIARPLPCTSCHTEITDVFSPGHIVNGIAQLTFGGLAITGNAVPSWNRATATCASTYCHGNYAGTYAYNQWDGAGNPIPTKASYVGKNATPVWTGAPMACDGCHDNPPRTGYWHSGSHEGGSACEVCHSDAKGTATGIGTAITDVSRHVNGTVDVDPNYIWLCIGCH